MRSSTIGVCVRHWGQSESTSCDNIGSHSISELDSYSSRSFTWTAHSWSGWIKYLAASSVPNRMNSPDHLVHRRVRTHVYFQKLCIQTEKNRIFHHCCLLYPFLTILALHQLRCYHWQLKTNRIRLPLWMFNDYIDIPLFTNKSARDKFGSPGIVSTFRVRLASFLGEKLYWVLLPALFSRYLWYAVARFPADLALEGSPAELISIAKPSQVSLEGLHINHY